MFLSATFLMQDGFDSIQPGPQTSQQVNVTDFFCPEDNPIIFLLMMQYFYLAI